MEKSIILDQVIFFLLLDLNDKLREISILSNANPIHLGQNKLNLALYNDYINTKEDNGNLIFGINFINFNKIDDHYNM